MSEHVLLRGGQVCDPGTASTRTADLLVSDGRVAAIGADLSAPDGAQVLDVTGLVVGPGFIDLHSHVDSIAGQRLQAMDGVCATLELEAGALRVDTAYDDAARAGRPLHYGYAASWASARYMAHTGTEPEHTLAVLGVPEWQRSSTSKERAAWLGTLETELGAGGLGIGILLGYAPRTDPAEFLDVARLAARVGAPTFTHVRELVEADPTTPVDGSSEIAMAAAETGAAMHHCHVNSTSRRHIDRVLSTLDESRVGGSRVTVEAYPYGAGSTAIGAFFLSPERLPAWGMAPSDLVLVDTGERIADVARLAEVRANDPGAPCIVHYLDERAEDDRALLRHSLAFEDGIVASDAMWVHLPDGSTESTEWPLPAGGRTHPRTAGTFTKSLRLMVREHGVWTWLEAFRRCSYLPARVLDGVCTAMNGKGHLGIGADADIVVLDPDNVTDRATFADPTRTAQGVRHLLVNGTFVVREGELDTDAFPGRPLRGG
ncbi:dihydroorotase-like cyclic amidohydrolase [Tamaricihabitans halophyticus]|uniref:Dihydroorotase-like cyclic amidohydrolase n=1 Tax=Tamaricihabitans halophyticus TaxID=1262583 RepID=A0A4R2QQ48_9PSEU|nr:amidohydrolase family protein [Tamaricihabitans halophyticus]TCP51840.1 dihydroorotase-like cyclic amidohydrolase [Tamaricihabitans halophyticus]